VERCSDFTFRGVPVRVMDKLRVLLVHARVDNTASFRTLREIVVEALVEGTKVIEQRMKEAKRERRQG
jgi:hypothetical protein